MDQDRAAERRRVTERILTPQLHHSTVYTVRCVHASVYSTRRVLLLFSSECTTVHVPRYPCRFACPRVGAHRPCSRRTGCTHDRRCVLLVVARTVPSSKRAGGWKANFLKPTRSRRLRNGASPCCQASLKRAVQPARAHTPSICMYSRRRQLLRHRSEDHCPHRCVCPPASATWKRNRAAFRLMK